MYAHVFYLRILIGYMRYFYVHVLTIRAKKYKLNTSKDRGN